MEINDYINAKLTHSIHTSERLSWRGCRRRHHWIFVDGWYPQTTPKPLEFGSAFHRAMEEWYDPMMWGKDPEVRLDLAIIAFHKMCNDQKNEYFKANIESDLSPEVEEDFKERLELGEGMLRYHCTKVSPKLDVGFKPLQVEIEFEVPIEDPDGKTVWCKCNKCWNLFVQAQVPEIQVQLNKQFVDIHCEPWRMREIGPKTAWWKGLPLTYGGRIDMLAEDDYGRYWLFDWKTAARLSGQEEGDSSDEFILLDDQITSYCWALWKLGIPVAGFVHHEIKKAFPTEPEPLTHQYKGRWYSANKTLPFEHDLYLETISEGDPSGLARGAYDEFLDWLKLSGPRYYSRKQVARSEEELRNAGRNIWLEACDIIDPNARIYPSPGRFACSFCAFRQPCIGTNRDEDVVYMLKSNFTKRDTRYWEHNKPSTEGRGGQ